MGIGPRRGSRHYDATVADTTARVPFLALELTNAEVSADLIDDFEELVRSSAYINGPAVASSRRVCRVLRHRVVRRPAERAGRAAARAAGGRSSSRATEVLVPAQTFVATYEAVSQAGAVPVPVAIRDDDYCMDPSAPRDAATERTQAIVPVHLFGQMADVVGFAELATQHESGPPRGRMPGPRGRARRLRAGTVGDVPRVQLLSRQEPRAHGEMPAALVTHDKVLAARVRALREHGQPVSTSRTRWVDRAARHPAGAVLIRKLPFLAGWNEDRRAAARLLRGATHRGRRLVGCHAAPRRRATCGICMWYGRRIPMRSPGSSRRGGIGAGATTRRPYISPGPIATLGYRPWRLSSGRGARARVPLLSRCSPASRKSTWR